MQMTNGEIITNYRQAKDRYSQIKILAELNGCSRSEIEEILVEGGALSRTRIVDIAEIEPALAKSGADFEKPDGAVVNASVASPALTPKIKHRPDVDYDKINELYKQGCTDKEIENSLGVSHSTVVRWRRRNNLQQNRRETAEATPAPRIAKKPAAKAANTVNPAPEKPAVEVVAVKPRTDWQARINTILATAAPEDVGVVREAYKSLILAITEQGLLRELTIVG